MYETWKLKEQLGDDISPLSIIHPLVPNKYISVVISWCVTHCHNCVSLINYIMPTLFWDYKSLE